MTFRRASASELHANAADSISGAGPPGHLVNVMEVTRPALVLGSGQPDAHVDRARAAAAGIEVARRRSGGGAVLVEADRVVWVDVVIPAGDPLWADDIGRAAWWVGDSWARVVVAAGAGRAEVWRQGMLRSAWSERVCFAGLGPGEVHVDRRKVVGISQRRSRYGALFQCAALLDWDPAPVLDVLELTVADRQRGVAELAGVAAGLAVASPDPQRWLVAAFLAEVERARPPGP